MEPLKELGRIEDFGAQLVCTLFKTFTIVLKDSLKVKEQFKHHLKYKVLKELTDSLLAKPTREILQELLNMVRS